MAMQRVKFTASSEKPVIHKDFLGGFKETLIHTPDAVDLSDILGGTGRVLMDHDPTRVVGNVVGAEVKGKKLHIEAEFDDELEEAAAVLRRLEGPDSLYNGVSVGWDYNFSGVRAEDVHDNEDYTAEVDLVKWTPREVSFTSVPADTSVGVRSLFENSPNSKRNVELRGSFFRSVLERRQLLERQSQEKETMKDEDKKGKSETKMDEDNKEKSETKAAASTEKSAATEKSEGASESRSLAGFDKVEDNRAHMRSWGVSDEDITALSKRARKEGLSAEAAMDAILELQRAKSPTVNAPDGGSRSAAVHTQKRDAGFSLARAIQGLADGSLHRGRGSQEAEQLQDYWQSRGIECADNELEIPTEALMLDKRLGRGMRNRYPDKETIRAVTGGAIGQSGNAGSTDATSGFLGSLVADFDEGALVESLYNKVGILKDVSFFPGLLDRDLKIPVQKGRNATAWVSGEIAARGTQTNMEIPRNITWSWREITSNFKASRRMIKDQVPMLEALLLNMLEVDIPRGISDAVINGTGADGQPTGIIATSDVNEVDFGTNGAKPTLPMVNAMITAVENDNAMGLGDACFYANSATRGILRTTQKFSQTDGTTLAMPVMGQMGGWEMEGYPLKLDQYLTATQTSGSAGAKGSQMLFCIPSEVRVGFFSSLIIMMDPYSSKGTGQVDFQARQALDLNVLHPEAFVVGQHILTA